MTIGAPLRTRWDLGRVMCAVGIDGLFRHHGEDLGGVRAAAADHRRPVKGWARRYPAAGPEADVDHGLTRDGA